MPIKTTRGFQPQKNKRCRWCQQASFNEFCCLKCHRDWDYEQLQKARGLCELFCHGCGEKFMTRVPLKGNPRRYCSDSCKQKLRWLQDKKRNKNAPAEITLMVDYHSKSWGMQKISVPLSNVEFWNKQRIKKFREKVKNERT